MIEKWDANDNFNIESQAFTVVGQLHLIHLRWVRIHGWKSCEDGTGQLSEIMMVCSASWNRYDEAYTASALKLMLEENLGKPVILTGFQLPLAYLDGR